MSLFDELRRRNVLRVAFVYLAASWLLIQVLETLFPIFRLDETSIQIVVIILGIGFIPALILSWVFELTPEGLKRDKDVDRSVPATIASGKGLDRIIIVVLVLALGYFAVDKFVLDPARDAEIVETASERARAEALYESFGEKSIAVLPFVNMSADPDQDYFADGISEELLNLLARIQELRVISRTSAFSFKGKDIDIPTVAEQLNVDHVLEGSVRKSGDKIRITAQLIDARTDSHIWSETFDRTLDDIFVIQDEIAAAVVDGLKVELLGEMPKTKKSNPEAYALYLRANHLLNQFTDEGPAQAKALAERALELDPEFVSAMAVLARAIMHLADNIDEATELAARRRARELVEKAEAIDPDDQQINGWLAWMALNWDDDLLTAAHYLERTLKIDPTNAVAIRAMGPVLRELGRFDAAIAIAEYVVDNDPLCVQCYYLLGFSYRVAGRYEEAEILVRTAMSLTPNPDQWRNALGNTLLLRRKAAAALAEFEKLVPSGIPLGKAMALFDLGRHEESEEALQIVIRDLSEANYWLIASAYAWRGDNDRAFDILDEHIRRIPNEFQWIQDPFIRNLEDDPRWHALLESVGRSPEQLAAISLKITLPPGVTLKRASLPKE